MIGLGHWHVVRSGATQRIERVAWSRGTRDLQPRNRPLRVVLRRKKVRECSHICGYMCIVSRSKALIAGVFQRATRVFVHGNGLVREARTGRKNRSHPSSLWRPRRLLRQQTMSLTPVTSFNEVSLYCQECGVSCTTTIA